MLSVSVAAVLSTVVSFAVLAGVLTGVCYVLLAWLQWAHRLRLSLPSTPRSGTAPAKCCARCGRHLSVLPLVPRRRIQCAHCCLPVCRRCCSQASNARWLCYTCCKLRDVRLQSGEWFYDQLRQRFRSTVATIDNTIQKDGEVQEFIESLVETMIGGGLDDVALHPISDQPQYITFCARHKDPLVHVLRRLYSYLQMSLSVPVARNGNGETVSDLHCELKCLMKQIVHEAMNQPKFKDGNGQSSWPLPEEESLGQRSYEDILATAILNKVFAKYQRCPRRKQCNNEKAFDRNSNVLSENLLTKMLCGSDSDESDSWSESSHHEPLSVTIEECIEEVTTRYSSDDEPASDMDRFLSNLKYFKKQRAAFPELGKDIVDVASLTSSDDADEVPTTSDIKDEDADLSSSVEQVNPVDTWEENWLFQRRRLKTNMGMCQPVPVPMLVPNPSSDCRAMIGDVDADEMSDLTDCSDSVLEDLLDGPDDKKYFESQLEDESEEEKSKVLINKQREVFLHSIGENLSSLIRLESVSGMLPDTEHQPTNTLEDDSQTVQVVECQGVELATKSPEESDSCGSYSVAEARNVSVPAIQVDSGEVSLDMQQDSEYTVAYATLAQVQPSSSPSQSPARSPVPKPRSVPPTNSQVVAENKEDDVNSSIGLSLPPKPGTIAEREHLKWEKAPPLANNPYSKENIERRQRQRMYLSRHSSSENSIEFPELTGTKEPSLLEIDSKHRRDECNKYVRDYYVNGVEGRKAQKQQLLPDRPSSAEPRPYPRSQTVDSCPLQQQVSVKVEVEVAVTKPDTKPTETQNTALSDHQVATVVTTVNDNSYISLPSVKELAKQFSHADNKVPTPPSPIAARKRRDIKLHSPVRQVHSLTARNISREMRETLRNTKVPLVPIVKVANDKELDSSGHVSEDSGTVSPTPSAPTRRVKLQNDIQFWEQLKQQR